MRNAATIIFALLLLAPGPTIAGPAPKSGEIDLDDSIPLVSVAASPLWRTIPPEGIDVAGRLVRVVSTGRDRELLDGEDRAATLRRLPVRVKLRRKSEGRKWKYAVALREGPEGVIQISTRQGLTVNNGSDRAHVLDLDLDGMLPEIGGDGLLHAASGTVGTFTGEVWFLTSALRASSDGDLVPHHSADTPTRHALCVLNHYRQVAGLQPVRDDPERSKGAALHARYLLMNWSRGMNRHVEDPGKPGYSKAGARAGRGGLQGDTPVRAVIDNLDIVYHRRGLLRPGLDRIGLGSSSGTDLVTSTTDGPGSLTILDVGTRPRDWGTAKRDLVLWPAAGQTGVPRQFSGRETPVPLPTGIEKTGHGYPVTALFYGTNHPKKTSLEVYRVVGKGKRSPMPGWSFGPDRLHPEAGGEWAVILENNSWICHFIPRMPFEPNARYEAVLRYGAGEEERWRFTTGKGVASRAK